MGSPSLPFGRTQATVSEIREHLDQQQAIAELTRCGVGSPSERLNAVVSKLPELLNWLESHGRKFPWRFTTNPWRIYTTEILLQRTRGDAVADIYHEFFTKFPTPEAVLRESEDKLRDCVRSLGFVNHRVQSIREAAELCVEEFDGAVPADLEALQQPWRVGPYTARACMLFAFEEPLALVDANTARIAGRVFNYPLPTQPHKSDDLYRFLDALVPDKAELARSFNLALLDLGALRCTDSVPACESCPLRAACTYAR